MRVALCVIIIYLGTIIDGLKMMPPFWNGIIAGIGWGGLINDYFKSKKK